MRRCDFHNMSAIAPAAASAPSRLKFNFASENLKSRFVKALVNFLVEMHTLYSSGISQCSVIVYTFNLDHK